MIAPGHMLRSYSFYIADFNGDFWTKQKIDLILNWIKLIMCLRIHDYDEQMNSIELCFRPLEFLGK